MQEEMFQYRRYIFRCLGVAGILFFLIGVFSICVDPYGLFQLFGVRGVNQQKEGVRTKIRYVKALELPLRNPHTIIIGSSRVHDGINPDNELLQKYSPVYNLGIDMLRIHEAVAFLKHATMNSDVKQVVFGIDFFMFNSLEKVNPSFDQKLVGRKIQAGDYFSSIFSMEALGDSLKTIEISHNQPERKEFISNGYRPAEFVFYKVKDYNKLHYYTNWVFLTPTTIGTPYYANYVQSEGAFKELEEFLSICRERKIDCVLFITPAHANLDGEGIKVAGLWDQLENFKRRLVTISAKYDTTLWDFSGYNSVTTEPVRTPMKYYWDSSHFSEVVGNYIICRLYGDDNSAVPADFGRILTMENVEEDLRMTRLKQEEYERAHPEEINLIHKIYKDATSLNTSILNEQISGMF